MTQQLVLSCFPGIGLLDMAFEARLLGDFPQLRGYMERMYARPRAPMRIAQAFASLNI